MKPNRLIITVVAIGLLGALMFQGCSTTAPLRPSASFPISGGKVWPNLDTTKVVPGVGTFYVKIQNGQISITPPEGLKVVSYRISSVDSSRTGPLNKSMSGGSTGTSVPCGVDTDGDGIPDCLDCCPDQYGKGQPNGCPPDPQGPIGQIRWSPILNLCDDKDALCILVQSESCAP